MVSLIFILQKKNESLFYNKVTILSTNKIRSIYNTTPVEEQHTTNQWRYHQSRAYTQIKSILIHIWDLLKSITEMNMKIITASVIEIQLQKIHTLVTEGIEAERLSFSKLLPKQRLIEICILVGCCRTKKKTNYISEAIDKHYKL